jgi:phage terminase large subunit GpA-like protein
MLILSPHVYDCWKPRRRTPAVEWVPANVRVANGDLFSLELFPYARGVLEAFDDPRRRQLVLQWATRLGKTTTGFALAEYIASENPNPMLFVSSVEKTATEALRDDLYPMLERGPLREQLRPKAKRSLRRVELAECHIRVGWSGSVSSLGGFKAWYGHYSEVSKYNANASDEADPLELGIERLKEFYDHKALVESTPTVRGRCRINRLLLTGTNKRFQVPCPWCHTHQELVRGSGKPGEGGIRLRQAGNRRAAAIPTWRFAPPATSAPTASARSTTTNVPE